MNRLDTVLTQQVGIDIPLICGAMYPCSNGELIAAASEAGGVGIIQPISLLYVHGKDLREEIQKIKRLTSKPVGFNAIVEKSSKIYEDRMKKWVDIALDEGVRFFVTALGNPRWVVDKVHAVDGIVYHDVTNKKWAQKALEGGVDGLICVNSRAGGHAGEMTPEELVDALRDLGKPLICAGGIGGADRFVQALDLGYAGVQLGTRFIATTECNAHDDYKQAILNAAEKDIVLTDKISGVPVSVIRTAYIDKVGTRAGPIARRLLRGRKTKHYMRMFYSLQALWQLKKSNLHGTGYKEYFQAGKSVADIHEIVSAGDVMRDFAAAAAEKAA